MLDEKFFLSGVEVEFPWLFSLNVRSSSHYLRVCQTLRCKLLSCQFLVSFRNILKETNDNLSCDSKIACVSWNSESDWVLWSNRIAAQ